MVTLGETIVAVERTDPTAAKSVVGRHRSVRRRIQSNVLWAGSGRFLSVFLMFLLHGRLAHHLSPDDYGRYVLLESITVILSLMILAGVPNVTLRLLRAQLVVGNTDAASDIVRISLRIVFFAAVLAALGISAFSFLAGDRVLRGMLWDWLPWIIGAATCTALLRLLSELARGHEMLGFSYFIGGQNGGFGVNGLLFLSVVFAGVFSHLTLLRMISIQIAVQLIVVGPALVIVLSIGGKHRPVSNAQTFGSLADVLRRSLPLLIHQLVMFGLPETDTLLLASYSTPEEIALYGAARKLVFFSIVPLLLVSHAIQPFITEFHTTNDLRRLTLMVRGMATFAGIPSFAVVLMLLVFPEFLLTAFFGEGFAPAAMPIRVLCVGAVAYVFTGPCGLVLTMTGHERAAMASSLTAGVLYVVAAPFVIAKFGILGAATCAACLQVFTNVSAMSLVYYYEKIVTGITFSNGMLRECLQLLFLQKQKSGCSEVGVCDAAGSATEEA